MHGTKLMKLLKYANLLIQNTVFLYPLLNCFINKEKTL